jgi:hypothetical protein
MRSEQSDMKLRNLIPPAFVVIHWVLFAAALIWRGHPHNFHFAYESLLLIILWVVDLPAMVVLLAFGVEIKLDLVTDNSFSVLAAAVIAISLQWWLIGIVLSRLIATKNARRMP